MTNIHTTLTMLIRKTGLPKMGVGMLMSLVLFSSSSQAEMLDTIIAIVNDDVVMESELSRHTKRIKNDIEQEKGQAPPDSVLEKQVLERLILMRIQLQEAEKLGINIDDDKLNRAISNIASQNGVSLETFRQTLESEGYSFNQFREEIREQITTTRLRQREVENRVFVSEREIDNFLATQSHQGKGEDEYRIQHILIATPEGADVDEVKDKANDILERLRSGSDFTNTARDVSDAGNASNGGDLGWMTKTELPSLFSGIVGDLKKGDVSDLIKNRSGFHIIKLADKKSSDIQMIEQIKARHILLKPNALLTTEEARLRLHNLKLRLEGGADFAELAQAHSEDRGSAVEGGDLGWLSPGITVPEFEKEMKELEVGEMSEPFKTQFGWHIVEVTGKREHDGTEEVTRAKARAEIKKRKVEEEYQTWLNKLRDEAYVEYR